MSGARLGVLAACAVAVAAAAMGSAWAEGDISASPPGVVGDTGATPPPKPDPVVAEVEGRMIHLSEVGDEVRSMPGGGGKNAFQALYLVAVRRLIERAALVIHADRAGLSDDPEVQRHLTEAHDRVLESAYLQHATAARVTEDMLLARYNSEMQGKPGPEEVHARAILVPTEAAAQAIIDKLAHGADFAALARQDSVDATAGSGGDLGFVRRADVNPMLASVLFALKPGEVTAYPVATPSGWFVLQVLERRQAPTPTFAEAREQLLAECEREQVLPVLTAALAGLIVRAYDMNGHVVQAPAPDESGDQDPNATQ